MKLNRSILVDGNNLLHRSKYVFVTNRQEDPLTNDFGYPTGITYGTLSILFSWISKMPKWEKVVFFLDGSPTRRLALYEQYKEGRDSSELFENRPITLCDGTECHSERDVLVHILKLVGIDIYFNPDEEADDLISKYVKTNPGHHVIISSDKDFYQLVDDKTILYRPDAPGSRFYDSERIFKEFGVYPEFVRLYKSLIGDKSDNITGVPRIRKKVAADLSMKYKTVESLLSSNMSECSVKEKSSIKELEDKIRLNYELVGFFDEFDLSSYQQEGKSDYDLANKILTKDLNIKDINVSSLKKSEGRVIISDFFGSLDLV
jgi:DNA polymerase-1